MEDAEIGPNRYSATLPCWTQLYESNISFQIRCKTSCTAPPSLANTLPRYVKLSTSSILSSLRVNWSVLLVFILKAFIFEHCLHTAMRFGHQTNCRQNPDLLACWPDPTEYLNACLGSHFALLHQSLSRTQWVTGCILAALRSAQKLGQILSPHAQLDMHNPDRFLQ